MSHGNVGIESSFSSFVDRYWDKLLPCMLKYNNKWVNANGKPWDPLIQAHTCLLALCSGCPPVAVGIPTLLLPGRHAKAAGTRGVLPWYTSSGGTLSWGHSKWKGPPALTLPSAWSCSETEPAKLAHGPCWWKQPGTERQNCPCCCPRGVLCGCLSLFKLVLCLVLKCKFFKGRGYKAAVPMCSSVSRTADGWLTGRLWQGCFSGTC